MQLTFAGDVCTMTMANFPPLPTTWQIDTSRTPREITLSQPARVSWPGIYLLDRDTLTLCLDHGGQQRPAEFSSRGGPSVFLYVLERVPPAGPEPGGRP
jgi:uncharacterized protein (TIGR03067 family)